MLRFLARLGLAKDERPLTHEFTQTESSNRKWRTSLIGSYAANLAILLYNCTDEYKVQVFLKEDVIHLDRCQNTLCTLREFLNAMGPVADQCAKDDGCSPNAAFSISGPSFLTTVIVVVYYVLNSSVNVIAL